MIEGRQEQINFCLNCTKDKCSGTACKGLKDYTAGIHRKTSEEIDSMLIKFLPYCNTWTELREATKCDRTTLYKHAVALGLDISKFRRRKNGRQKSQAPQGAGHIRPD